MFNSLKKMSLLILAIIIIIGDHMSNIMAYNRLLTYTIRYSKLTFQGNITGNYIINQYREHQYVSGELNINSKNEINKVIIIFNRCNSEGIDCEYFQSWTLTDLCPMLNQKNEIWSSWYAAFDPPMKCPILTFFRLRNASIDVQEVIRWYPDATNYQWKTTQKMYSDKILVGSYTIYNSIFGYRKRIKTLSH